VFVFDASTVVRLPVGGDEEWVLGLKEFEASMGFCCAYIPFFGSAALAIDLHGEICPAFSQHWKHRD
jgi:hypothetical protein